MASLAAQAAVDAATIFILLVVALVPPILFVVWIRNTERFEREPWRAVFWLFVWGMVFAILIAVLLEAYAIRFGNLLEQDFVELGRALQENPSISVIVLVVIVAPLMEELAKGLGVYSVRRQITEVEDGLVYGSAAGLGFAATENLFYGLFAYINAPEGQRLAASLTVIVVRSFSSALLHASASSVFGFGIAKHHLARLRGLHGPHALPYFFMAVAMHGTFNFLASFGELFRATYGEWAALFGFVAAVLFAIGAIGLVRGTIRRHDRYMGPPSY